MKLICSYCRKTIREAPARGSVVDVSHGMCPACADYFERLWGGMPLAEYLDLLPKPVLVVNGDGRLVAANQRVAELCGRARADLRGLLGGEALACVHSRLPEGCGKTVHCRECTIRNTVTRVTETRRPAHGVPAYLQTSAGRVPLTISARNVGDYVEVTVDDVQPAEPVAA
jgi:PAS domain-containing protein